MKRPYSAIADDDDDDEPSLGRQVLPIAHLPADFDGEPADGMQYLFTVRRDAQRLPRFTRVANPFESQRTSSSQIPAETTPKVSPLPSETWRDEFVKRFTRFRENSAQATIGVQLPSYMTLGKGSSSSSNSTKKRSLPELKDRDAWWAFIAGHPDSVWDPPPKKKKTRDGERSKGKRKWDRDSGARWEDMRHVDAGGGQGESEHGYEHGHGDFMGEVLEEAQETYVVNEYGEVEAQSMDEHELGTDDLRADVGGDGTNAAAAATSLPTPSGTPTPHDRNSDITDVCDPGDRPSAIEGGEGKESSESTVTVASQQEPNANASTRLRPRQPTPALLRTINSRSALHLLKYHTHWLNTFPAQPHPRPRPSYPIQTHARWIFALLARIEPHPLLTGDEVSVLRTLARACVALLVDIGRFPMDYLPESELWRTTGVGVAALGGEPGGASDMDMAMGRMKDLGRERDREPMDGRACWIIVTAVAGYWAQRDLWMDAENALATSAAAIGA